MAGNRFGPAEGALPCDRHSWEDYQDEVWHKKLNNYSYPPKKEFSLPWCESGGQIYWGPPWAQESGASERWGGQMCDCPHGRSGLGCEGCASSAGCGGHQRCDKSLKGDDVRLKCYLEESAPDNSVYKLLNDFAPFPVFSFTVEQNTRISLDVLKPVQHPMETNNKVVFSPFVFASTTEGARGPEELLCPPQDLGEVAPPWEANGHTRCLRWSLKDEIDFKCPPMSEAWPQNPRGWARFGKSCPMLQNFFKPPVDMTCALRPFPPSADGLPRHGCLARAVNNQFTFRLNCSLAGKCLDLPPRPSPGPAPGPSPSPADDHPLAPPPPPMDDGPIPYCFLHKRQCDKAKVTAVFLGPLLAACLALGLWQGLATLRARGDVRSPRGRRSVPSGGGEGPSLLPTPMYTESFGSPIYECTTLSGKAADNATMGTVRACLPFEPWHTPCSYRRAPSLPCGVGAPLRRNRCASRTSAPRRAGAWSRSTRMAVGGRWVPLHRSGATPPSPSSRTQAG